MTAKFVSPRVPLVDPRTGLVTREWYLFFQDFFSMGVGVDDELLPAVGPMVSGDAIAADLEGVRSLIALSPPYSSPPISRDDLAPSLPAAITAPDDLSPARRELGLATPTSDGLFSRADKAAFDAEFTSWTPYVPANLYAGVGAFGSASAAGFYKQIGKTVFFSVAVTIVANGTASVYFVVSSPTAIAAYDQAVCGAEAAAVGYGVAAVIVAGSTNILVRKADASYAGGSGHKIILQGTYEAA